jgi:hypothetical protein
MAAQCARLAEISHESEKPMLLELAELWRRLASRADTPAKPATQ